jgi:hypothetical protein
VQNNHRIQIIESKIFRGQQVMLDRDLAALYPVETNGLTQTFRHIVGVLKPPPVLLHPHRQS